MKYFLALFITAVNLTACSQGDAALHNERPLPANMQYNYDCVTQSSNANKITNILNIADDMFNKIATANIEITDKEQNDFGETFLTESKKEPGFKMVENTETASKLKFILTNLLRVRENPSGINYKIYLLKDESSVNAYTAGGKIFVTTAIVKKCKTEDQLYAIIGHEIGHNEKGHIKNTMKQLKVGKEYFGDNVNVFLGIKNKITGAFNQKNEVEADYYGLDLAYKLGYNVCAIKAFWDDMAASEDKNIMEDFFRTHPYSDVRSQCLTKHIKNNFKQTCN